MYAKKRPLWRVLLMIAAVALICALIGSAVGKYIYTETISASVTFSAEMAESMVLQESTAQRQADGHYELSAAPTDSNTYELIPGLDVPKNPHIVITGKTPVKAYLFVEVVENLPGTIEYTIADGWTSLGQIGKHNGTVYVYKTTLDEGFPADPIYILKNNTVTVSERLLLTESPAGDDVLTFYASLGEVASGNTQTEVYQSIP